MVAGDVLRPGGAEEAQVDVELLLEHRQHLLFLRRALPFHPNGLRFTALDTEGAELWSAVQNAARTAASTSARSHTQLREPGEPDEWEVLAKLALVISGQGVDADPAVIDDMATRLSRRYGVLLPNVGLNYYRGGNDSVPVLTNELVALAQPGPWRPRTIELGDYHGVFDGDRLVAMAGERQKVVGGTEVSAVCTHPDARRRGLGAGITARVVRGILDRGETPFLHHSDENPARTVYEALGFHLRRSVQLVIVRPPSA